MVLYFFLLPLLGFSSESETSCPFFKATVPSLADKSRAALNMPNENLLGEYPEKIRNILNSRLKMGPMAMPNTKSCDSFTIEELANLEHFLHCQASDDLTYEKEDGRAGQYESAADLQHKVKDELDYIKKYPEVTNAIRDGKCASVARAWVHHITDSTRAEIRKKNVTMPLLASHGLADHLPMLKKNGHTKFFQQLRAAITCEAGHLATKKPSGQWKGFPDWPDEVTYNASGYGPYPFWHGPGGGRGSLTVGSPVQTWWSALKNAERLDHNGKCVLSDLGGVNGPCTHLFVDQYAYLFSQDQKFCCISSTPQDACHLTRPQRDFYKVMNYQGITENYVSESGYYHGSVKNYTLSLTNPSNFWFWYLTDLNDKPIEQGEGGCVLPRGCSGGRGPKYLFHQYNPNTFVAANISQDVFTIPDVCKSSSAKACEVEPTFFCTGRRL